MRRSSSNLQRLDEDASGNLILLAQASVSFKGAAAPRYCAASALSCTPPAPDVPGEVTAISTAVGQLADGLAAMLLRARDAIGRAIGRRRQPQLRECPGCGLLQTVPPLTPGHDRTMRALSDNFAPHQLASPRPYHRA